MTNTANWDHKDVWHCHGSDFLVEIKRHSFKRTIYGYEMGPHNWAVYAYIYPKHRLFCDFKGTEMYQDAATALPLHCGPSFLCWHYDDDGKPTSVQVGADYSHLYDDRFSNYGTADEAFEVFADAERLFLYLAGAQP